jgi:alpha-1,2-mannosyltransferase
MNLVQRANQVRTRQEPIEAGVFIGIPLVACAVLVWFVSSRGGGGDFDIFRAAGNAVLHGRSPYVEPTRALLASNDRFVYPTPFALPFVPFAVMPERVAAALYLCSSITAVLIALRLLGVRDRRCYGVALVGIPAFGGFILGAVGPFLLLLLAIGWRYRDRTVAGVPLALAAAAKLFVWPVLVWLVVTRRWRAAAAATVTLASVLLLWLAIDPTGMRRYPETVHVLNEVERWKSYSPQSLMISIGLPVASADVLIAALAVATVAAIAVAARSRGEDRAFGVAVVGALVATPILWLHYLILLLVPIALVRPRLAPLWFLPLALWVSPHPESLGITWRIAIVLGAVAVVATATLLGRAQPDQTFSKVPIRSSWR